MPSFDWALDWAFWCKLTGIIFLALGFLFKEFISALIQKFVESWKARRAKKKDSIPLSTLNGNYIKREVCELKHLQIATQLEQIGDRMYGIEQLDQRTLEHQIKISEDLGKIKGKLNIE